MLGLQQQSIPFVLQFAAPFKDFVVVKPLRIVLRRVGCLVHRPSCPAKVTSHPAVLSPKERLHIRRSYSVTRAASKIHSSELAASDPTVDRDLVQAEPFGHLLGSEQVLDHKLILTHLLEQSEHRVAIVLIRVL